MTLSLCFALPALQVCLVGCLTQVCKIIQSPAFLHHHWWWWWDWNPINIFQILQFSAAPATGVGSFDSLSMTSDLSKSGAAFFIIWTLLACPNTFPIHHWANSRARSMLSMLCLMGSWYIKFVPFLVQCQTKIEFRCWQQVNWIYGRWISPRLLLSVCLLSCFGSP